MRNVAFWSSTPQQGKTTASRFLVDNYDYVKISFADPLRSMIERLLISAGHSKREAQYFLGEGKEQEIQILDTNFRHLARTLGTEWGRNCIHRDIWVKIAEKKIASLHSPICVDDVRFPNEINMLKKRGFLLIKIERDSLRADYHQSDTALRDFSDWDHVIKNNQSLENLCSQVYSIVK